MGAIEFMSFMNQVTTMTMASIPSIKITNMWRSRLDEQDRPACFSGQKIHHIY